MTREERKRRAIELFANGMNCAQAVLLAYSDVTGLDERIASRVASGLGGGARAGELCGAVSGAVLAIGACGGPEGISDAEAKRRTYERTTAFTRAFRERQGALACRDILGYDISTPEGDARRIAETQRPTPACVAAIERAIDVLEDLGVARAQGA